MGTAAQLSLGYAMTSTKYLELADECIRMIPAIEPQYRQALVRMAEEWLLMAKTFARVDQRDSQELGRADAM
jgi:hypothetical protein